MVIPGKEPQSLCGRSIRTGIHPDTETVISDITRNKISCYLSAGYSTRVQSVLPMHSYRWIGTDISATKKACTPDKIFWAQFPALSTATSYFTPDIAVVSVTSTLCDNPSERTWKGIKKIPDRKCRVIPSARRSGEGTGPVPALIFDPFFSFHVIWTFSGKFRKMYSGNCHVTIGG